MQLVSGLLVLSFSLSLVGSAAAQSVSGDGSARILLNVPAGAPIRLYLTKRVSKRVGAPVEAKVMAPVYAFDREVIPAGTVAIGKVSRTESVGKWRRAAAILNGDFTPLRKAVVEFTALKLPDGRELSTRTLEAAGLNSMHIEPSGKKRKQNASAPNGGVLGLAKQTAKDRLNGALNARSRGFSDVVRGPNKKEKLVDLLWSKAPYHPQYWRRGTRFDAALRDPLAFGSVAVKPEDLGSVGTQPSPDCVAHVRLLTALSSETAKQGEHVEAVVTAPLFSADHKLVLPEGTRLTGEVAAAKPARSFHRAGRLRFTFQKIELPQDVTVVRNRPAMRTQAILDAAEGSGKAPIKVDGEGGVQAKESKTRFLAPLVALVMASKAADNDAGKHTASGSGEANVSGRTLGGGLGLGMLGAAVSQTSPYVGMAFGYYGLAWSVYNTVIGRGGEVEFQKNAMMDVNFGGRKQ